MSLTYRLFRTLSRLICWIWAPLEVRRRERIPATGPAILVANHRSLIDGILFVALCDRPVAFVSAPYLFELPVVGWVLSQVSVPTGSVTGIRKTLAHVENGGMVALFPERGVRVADSLEGLGENAAFLASRTGAPVIPVAIRGADDVLPADRRWPRKRRKVELLVGEPRPVPPGLKRDDLLKVTTEWMAEVFAM